jgi:pimeloyl-ACP methyl ester carboxylesterase
MIQHPFERKEKQKMPQLRLPHAPHEYLDFTLTLPDAGRPADILMIYIHGFASHQKGEKVLYLRDRWTAAGCAFLAFDHRGHGDSSGTMAELTVTRSLEDLDAIITTQGMDFKQRVLIGSSMGGQTAAWYAARYPDRITANLLIAPGFRFLENRIRDLGPDGVEGLLREGKMTVRNEWVEVTIGKGLLEDAKRYPVKNLLPAYQTPTLILHGTQDDSVPFEDSVAFAQKTSARPMDLLLIAGGDHRLTDHKETLFLEMHTFCQRIGLFR